MTSIADLQSNEESTRVSDQILTMLSITISQIRAVRFLQNPSITNSDSASLIFV
jgi:hypothetical protein